MTPNSMGAFSPHDKYADIVASGAGQRIAKTLGLPMPPRLTRFDDGEEFTRASAVVFGAGPSASACEDALAAWGFPVVRSSVDVEQISHLVICVSDMSTVDEFNQAMLQAADTMRRLVPNARIIFVALCDSDFSPPMSSPERSAEAVAVQRAAEGAMRSLAHEVRKGATANLIKLGAAAVEGGLGGSALAALRFFSSTRSCFVNGQPLLVAGPGPSAPVPASTGTASTGHAPNGLDKSGEKPARPLVGQVAVVTGAARGIGAEIARVLHRDGARIIAVDVPAAGDALAKLANTINSTALQLDVTALDAGERIIEHAKTHYGRLDAVIHNAGITRDKLLANMDENRWNAVLAVNLQSQLRINQALLDSDLFKNAPRVVSLASTSAIAGNRGQTNYAASKAGVMASVAHLSRQLAPLGGTANAVAPGFIETEMTAKIPLMTRQVARRLSSLGQGGLPLDVAEVVAFLAWPSSVGIQGQTLRVCGQNLVGA